MTAKLVMRVATPAARAIQADGLPFYPENTAQIAIAALIGVAAASYEDALAHDIPLVIDEPGLGMPPCSRALRHDEALDRTRNALCRIFKRAGQPAPSDIELEVMATKVVSHVSDQIKTVGLYVNTQKVLFSPRYAEIAMRVLAEMKDPVSGEPVTASGAIAAGLIPPPPSRDLRSHLRYLGPRSAIGDFGFHEPRFADWVARNRPFAIEFPPPNVCENKAARYDTYSKNDYSTSAELGLGFLLVFETEKTDHFTVAAPFLTFRRKTEDASASWWHAFRVSGVRAYWGKDQEVRKVKSLLADKKYQAARLDMCQGCGEIFSEDRADLHCACAK